MAGHYSEADLVAMIPLYLDGELAGDEQDAVDAYLAAHPTAVAHFAEAARLIDLLDSALTPEPVDDAFTHDVMSRVRALTPGQRWWHRVGLIPPLTAVRWAFEAALLGVLAVLLWFHPWAPAISAVECRVLADGHWVLGRPAAARVVLVDRETGRPVANANVRLALSQDGRRNTLATGRTNDHGSLDTGFALPANLQPGDATLLASVGSRLGRTGCQVPLTLEQQVRYQVDPAAARLPAGSDLLARVSASDGGSGRPLARQQVPWELASADTHLAGGEVTLSEFGQALLTVPTSRSLPPQSLTLSVGTGPARHVRRIELTEPCGDDLLARGETAERSVISGQTVRGAVVASTPDGLPAVGAEARLELRLASGGAVASATSRLDDSGRWDFAVTAPTVTATRELAFLDIRVTAPDGRRGWTEARLPAASRAVLLELVPGSTALVAGLDNDLIFRAVRPDGSPVQAAVDAWFNDLHASLWTDSAGTGRLQVQARAESNSLVLAAEVDGQHYEAHLTVPTVVADRALAVQSWPVGVGEALYVSVRSPGRVSGPVFLDLLAGGQIVTTRSLSLVRGAGSLVLPVPPGLSGRLALRAYAVAARGVWRVGWTAPQLPRSGELKVTLDGGDERTGVVSVRTSDADGQPVRAQLWLTAQPRGISAVAATARPPETAEPSTASEPLPPAAPLITANSLVDEQQRAVHYQRVFFRRAPDLGALLGGLLLLSALLWVVQTWSDPFEYVSRAERRAWGRVPQVHRRGAWAGYGALVAAVLGAVVTTAGMALAGHQAQSFAESAREPSWRPELAAWPAPEQPASVGLEHFLPGGTGSVTLLATDEAGRASWPWGDRGGVWRLQAAACTADGTAGYAEGVLAPRPQLKLVAEAPRGLRVGDRLTVPVTLTNPLDLAAPAVLTASVDNGLDLGAAPTQRVVLPRAGRIRLGVPLLAAEAGHAVLKLKATSADLSTELTAEVDVLPAAPRTTIYRFGRADSGADLGLDVPADSAGRRLELTVAADSLQPLDRALARVVARPAFTASEAAAQTEAAALRCELAQTAGVLTEARRAALVPDLVRAYQRLTPYEARDGAGQPTGGFSPASGAPPQKLLTARVLTALRNAAVPAAQASAGSGSAESWSPVDPKLVQRSSDWLASKQRSGTDGWLAEGPAVGLDQPESGLRTTAAVLLALASGGDNARLAAAAAPLAERSGSADAYTRCEVASALLATGQTAAARDVLKRLVEGRDERPEGTNWYPGPQPVSAGATGRGAAVETTAQVVRLLAAADLATESARRGAAWLQRQAQSDGTWGSARATVAAVRALAAVDPPASGAIGWVRAELDGHEIGRTRFDGDQHEMHVVASPEPGARRLKLSYTGLGHPSYTLRLGWSKPTPPAEGTGLRAVANLDRTAVEPGGVVTATLRVRNTGTQAVPAIVATVPLPPGFVPADAGQAIDQGEVRLAVGTLSPDAVAEVSLPLRARVGAASVTPPEARVEATYDPARLVRLALPTLTVG